MNKRAGLAIFLSIASFIQCTVIITMYLIEWHEDLSFFGFLCLLLLPLAVEVAIICVLMSEKTYEKGKKCLCLRTTGSNRKR